MLHSISGKTHRTWTLLAILAILAAASTSTRALSQEEIEGLDSFKIAIPKLLKLLPVWQEDTATRGCHFTGVYCDPDGHVKTIHLPTFNLGGSMPAKLWYFPSLETLSIESQGLVGTIPSEIANLTKCQYLNLGDNELSGTIPESICSMPLQRLSLNDNRLMGTLPPCLGSLQDLIELDIIENLLNGSFPDSIWSLPSLEVLGTSNNRFTGTISDDIGQMIDLRVLFIADNRFTGSLPESIGQLTNLSEFRFNNNFFSGSIPTSLTQIYNITGIDGSNNRFNGTLPDFSRTDLHELNFANNQLTGPLHKEGVEWLPHAALILSQNQLSGTIPSWYNGKELSIIRLADNQLSGTIPDLSKCPHLTELDLHGNDLTGTFPDIPERLQKLDMSYNRLHGNIPAGHIIGEMTELYIQHNQFSGEMTPFMMNTLSSLDISANNFTFDIYALRPYVWLGWLNASHNNLFGSVDDVLVSLKPYLVSVDVSHNRLAEPVDWNTIGARFRHDSLTYLALNGNPIPPITDYRAVDGLSPLNFSLVTPTYSCRLLSFNTKSGEFIYDDSMFSYSSCQCNDNWVGEPPNSCLSCSDTLAASATCNGSNTFWKEMNYYAYFDSDKKLRTEPCLASPELLRAKLNPCPRVEESLSDVKAFEQHCALGSTGRRCSQCICPSNDASKCWFSRDFHCVECKATLPPRTAVALFFVLLSISLLLLTFFIAKSLSNRSFLRAKPLNEQPKAMLVFLLIFARLRLATQHGLLYITITFIQFSTELVQWNLAIEQAIFNLTNGDVTGFGLQCVFRKLNQPLYIFLIQTTAPFALLCFIWLAVGIAKLISLRFVSSNRTGVHIASPDSNPAQSYRNLDGHSDIEYSNGSNLHASEESKSYDPSRRLLDQSSRPSESDYASIQNNSEEVRNGNTSTEDVEVSSGRNARSLGVSLTIAAVNLLYFGFATNTVRAFFWEQQQYTNNYFMAMHPFMIWDDPEARNIRAFARFFLSFVICVPLVIFSLLWVFRKRARDPKVLAYLGPLFRSFTARQFWWEMVLTARKIVIAVIIGAIPESNVFRPWAVVSTISLFLGLQLYFQPWRRKIENYFDQISSIVLILTYVPHFQSSGMNGGPALLVTTKTIVLLFILVALGFWIWKSATEPLVAENQKKSKKKARHSDEEENRGNGGKFLRARFNDLEEAEIAADDINEPDLLDGAVAASLLEEEHGNQLRWDNESAEDEDHTSADEEETIDPQRNVSQSDDDVPAPRSFIEGIMESMPFDPVSRLSIPNPSIQGSFGAK
jgi:Leucine-rich repeat (LRR) protein